MKIPLRFILIMAFVFLFSALAFANEEAPSLDEEFWDVILSVLPSTWEGWTGAIIIVCAILAAILPRPPRDAHPLVRTGHRIICCLGLGASRLKGKTGALSRIGATLRRRS